VSLPIAAERGFSFADPYVIALLFCAVAVFAAIGALSHQHERAFSASIIYLGLGAGAAIVVQLVGISWIDPIEDASLIEHLSELAVIIALFATGLKLDLPLEWSSWSGVARLLGVAMPLTILGAILAPTDPVLAGDIGVGPPGEEDEHEPNFSITGEAGLNDGLALPFLFLGLFMVAEDGGGWFAEWLLADVLYAIGVGAAIGVGIGYGLGGLALWLRERDLLAVAFDGWLAIPSVLAIYAIAEIAGALGFIAAFAGGLAYRRYESAHEINLAVHDGAEVVEKFGELVVILLLGTMLSLDGLGAPGVAGWLLVPALILVIRPVSVLASLARSGLPGGERAFLAWFGVRGIGSLYYAAIAVGAGVLSAADAKLIAWTAIACVGASIVVHGVTATSLSRRWLPPGAVE
jgi:sodium/hydrogen antiporter